MTETVNAILEQADYFVLLFMRVSGLLFVSPIFGRSNIPIIARIGLMAAISFLLFNVYPQTVPLEYNTLLGFIMLVAGELLLGITLAFVVSLFFSVVAFVAGQLIDFQIGFGIVNVFDVQLNVQVPMLGNILNIMLLLVFFITDGHLQLIYMIDVTLYRLPVGTLTLSPMIGFVASEIFARAFLMGVMMAMPIIASGMILEVGFGVLMRAVPQIHMFVIGIPLKVIVGLVIIAFTLPVFSSFSRVVFEEMFNSMSRMFAALAGVA